MIRPSRPDDGEVVLQLAQQFNVFGPYVAEFERRLRQLPPTEFFVYEDDGGNTIGFAAVVWSGATGDIIGVAVDPAFKRQGIATRFLEHIERIAREKGVTELKCITAEPENPSALACFLRYGFENLGFAGNNYPLGQRAVNLAKMLA